MAEIKVNQLAKEYGLDAKVVIKDLTELGEYVKTATAKIPVPFERQLRKKYASLVKDNSSEDSKGKTEEKTTDVEKSEAVKPDAKKSDGEDNKKEDIPKPSSIADIPKPKIPTPMATKPDQKASPLTSGLGPGINPGMIKRRPQIIARPSVGRTLKPRVKNGGTFVPGFRPGFRPNDGSKRPTFTPGDARKQGGKFGSNQPKDTNNTHRTPSTSTGQKPGGFTPPKGPASFKGKQNRFSRGVPGAAGSGQKKNANHKKKRIDRTEIENIERPTAAGITLPHGDGTTIIRLKQGANLTDFAEKINTNAAQLVMQMMKLGQMVNQNQSLDEETFELLGLELGYKIEMVSQEEEDRQLLEQFGIDREAEDANTEGLETRPPVVTVMGHVDHGKTKLLDAIRNTDLINQEAGGITQKIGAYQVHVNHDDHDRLMTFIDTPGHEAFTAMRARGAEITDVAILVVAADDGVMPQTVEAINHAQSAGVPIVVAVNKIDKEGADATKVRGQLTEFNLVPEEYGGTTMFVDISAKQGIGINELLDAVLLTVDATMELQANPDMPARGSVIESRLDKGRGAVTSVLVMQGTLRVGDPIVAGRSYGKVRAMTDATGKKLKEVKPSQAARIIGMQSVPIAGDDFLAIEDERTARQIAERREAEHRAALLAKRRKRITLEDFKQAVEDHKVDVLNLIIKGDTSGSVEAIEDNLMKLEENAELNGEVGINIIHRGVGSITQNDVNLATVDNAIIIGFNVKPAGMAGDLADAEGVDIRLYSVIYKVMEEIELSLHGLLRPEYEENITGYAEVRELFKSSKAGIIAGSIVRGGEIKRGSKARIMRNQKAIAEDLKIESLKRFKDDVNTVADGFECGIGVGSSYNDLEIGDIIETYETVEKERVVKKIASRE